VGGTSTTFALGEARSRSRGLQLQPHLHHCWAGEHLPLGDGDTW
jgi:hypothetical protein